MQSDRFLLVTVKTTCLLLEVTSAISIGDGHDYVPFAGSHIMSSNLVDYQAMQLIVGLPCDASQSQVLKALVQMEASHRPVRRSEKRALNEARNRKTLKYKLEGARSKIRVKDPREKAFVLLQASIGRVSLDDVALRQEMNSMSNFRRECSRRLRNTA